MARLTSKGQITIPKVVRDRLGLQTGDEVDFVEENGVVTLRKRSVTSPFLRYRGYLAHLAGSDPDVLVAEMRGE